MARILLGVTGSVAAVKTPALCEALAAGGHEVKVAPTRAALSFFDPAALPATGGSAALPVRDQHTVYLDEDEWPQGRLFEVGEPVLHIELRKWADLLLIAPLDAQTLAKLALGLSDNLLTCVYRAWDFDQPVVLAPAMNTLMWEHPATQRHLSQLMVDHHGGTPPVLGAGAEAFCDAINHLCARLRVVPPQSKRLACGDEGMGGLAEVEEIVSVTHELALRHQS
ncbi:MAG: flavoprotein [Armatimonadota bacterium]